MFAITEKVNLKEVGGKAFRLSKLTKEGMRVPSTLVISVEEVEHIVKNQRVPSEIIEHIYSELSFKSGLAIRSSGVGEDGSALSWAGQFKSLLCVTQDNLATAIISCANARKSDAVLSYARLNKTAIPPLALIVQEMVNTEFAGVAFTFNPVTGSNQIVIELVEGCGDTFVSGTKSGDYILIDPFTREIISKERRLVNLENNHIDKLVDVALKGKILFGNDQDIEFAYEKGTHHLYVLQSRDITSERPVEVKVDEIRSCVITDTKKNLESEINRLNLLGLKISLNVFSDQNIAEILTLNPTPMTLGLFNYIFAHGEGAIRTARNEMGYEIGEELNKGFFSFVGGRPRCSIVHDACTYRIRGIPLEDYTLMVEGYLKDMIQNPKLANYPEVVLYDQNPPLSKLISLYGKEKGCRYREAYDVFHNNLSVIMEETDGYCRNSFIPAWQKQIRQEENRCVDTIENYVSQYSRLTTMLRTEACPMFVKAARLGFFAYASLRNMLLEIFGDEGEQYINVLTAGTDMSLNPNLQFSLELAKVRDGLIPLSDVVQQFGHLSVHELEIGTPRYKENPDIIKLLSDKIIGNPMDDYHETVEKYKALRTDLLKRAGSMARKLEYAIHVARLYLPLREVVKFEYLRAYNLIRRNVLAIERLLNWREDNAFYLYPDEVFALCKEHKEMYCVSRERRAEFDSYKNLFVPPVIFSDNLDTIGILPEGDGQNMFKGLGVTNVSVTGEVVVMRSPDDAEAFSSLRPGCILVTKTTDPAWGPVLSIMGKGGGLVTEVGGMLAHGAIYAREIGLAAVLNVPGITGKLKTGMKVFVNGSTGTVEVLS